MPTTEQLLLSEELFERYSVPVVRVSLSGTIEVPLEGIRDMTDGLEPGDAVAIVARGHVLDVSAPYSPKTGDHTGRLVLRAEIIAGIERVGDA